MVSKKYYTANFCDSRAKNVDDYCYDYRNRSYKPVRNLKLFLIVRFFIPISDKHWKSVVPVGFGPSSEHYVSHLVCFRLKKLKVLVLVQVSRDVYSVELVFRDVLMVVD